MPTIVNTEHYRTSSLFLSKLLADPSIVQAIWSVFIVAYSNQMPDGFCRVLTSCWAGLFSSLVGVLDVGLDGKSHSLFLFHPATLSVFSILATEYLVRYHKRKPARPLLVNNSSESLVGQFSHPRMDPSAKLLLIGLFFESLFLFIRYVHMFVLATGLTLTPNSSIYRTIELADGFDGRIIRTEIYFSEYCIYLFESRGG